MKFHLKGFHNQTLIAPEILEIYQPVMGYEAIILWINLYHNLLNGHSVGEAELLQQMNMSLKIFRGSLQELAKFGLVEQKGEECSIIPPLTVDEFKQLLNSDKVSSESKRRLTTLVESFQLKRGYVEDEQPETEKIQVQISEHVADEFATRFIKECNFIPNKQLRERFDIWFEQINDPKLLEELLERTKRKVQLEGSKGLCPSIYADKIVRQWQVQGINSYNDLARHDQEFHAKWEYYRIVEKELGRSFNSLTPSEKEIIDGWVGSVSSTEDLRKILKKVILSGDYQGKGAPGIIFIDQWLNKQNKKHASDSPAQRKQKAYTHQHQESDLQQAIKRKTMGLEEG